MPEIATIADKHSSTKCLAGILNTGTLPSFTPDRQTSALRVHTHLPRHTTVSSDSPTATTFFSARSANIPAILSRQLSKTDLKPRAPNETIAQNCTHFPLLFTRNLTLLLSARVEFILRINSTQTSLSHSSHQPRPKQSQCASPTSRPRPLPLPPCSPAHSQPCHRATILLRHRRTPARPRPTTRPGPSCASSRP